MARYYRRPDGIYETSRTVNGKRVRFRGRTCAEVDRKILEYREDTQRGRKVSVIAEEWYSEHSKHISASTKKLYSWQLKQLCAALGSRRAGDISPRDCQQYIWDIGRAGYARETVSIASTVLKLVFSHAVMAGDVDANPAAEVRIARNLPKARRTALTVEQERKVDRCREGNWWLLGIMFLYTGCRRGELLALTWEDVNFERREISVSKKLNYAIGNVPVLEPWLKSANGMRVVPLLDPLAQVLPRGRRGKIFTDADGNYLTTSKFAAAWREYCRDAGLTKTVNGKEVPAVTPHCFRHSFATICFEAGVDSMTAASMVGDTEQVVRGVYTELRAAHREAAVQKMHAFFDARAGERE